MSGSLGQSSYPDPRRLRSRSGAPGKADPMDPRTQRPQAFPPRATRARREHSKWGFQGALNNRLGSARDGIHGAHRRPSERARGLRTWVDKRLIETGWLGVGVDVLGPTLVRPAGIRVGWAWPDTTHHPLMRPRGTGHAVRPTQGPQAIGAQLLATDRRTCLHDRIDALA
jgi:hypothetical protein